MANKIIIFLIISVIILGAVGYWIYEQNGYSKEILRLEIIGPETAKVGEEVEYSVRLKNNGDVRLEEPRLVFEYPSSAETVNGEPLRITKESQELGGAIYPGEEKVFRFRARLFGKEGETEEAKAMVSYRPRNLKARYVSKTSCLTTIGEVPLTLEFDASSGVGSGQEMNFSLNYFSSIDYSLSDLEIKTAYPPSFELKAVDPEGVSDNEWRISHLNKAEGGRIDFKGILKGETGETKIFKAEIGFWRGDQFIVLKEATKQVSIIEPSLYIIQTINGSPDYTANPGDLLHYEITFRNIGDTPLQHLFLASKLNGDLFDFESIRSPRGQSQSGDHSIIWDWRNVSNLQFLNPGEEGTVEFWINLKDDVENINKAELENEVILDQSRRKFVTKVRDKVELAQDAYVDDEIFGSQSNLPPRIGEKSLFTIIWKVRNYYNPVKDAKMQAVLPPQTRLTGKVLPQKLSFDPATREIVWSIGDLAPNQGAETPLQLAFQIELKPTSNQKGDFAQLVEKIIFRGFDEWTEQQLEASSTPLTTEVFGEENGRVK